MSRQVRIYRSLDELPACYEHLFEAVEAESFFNSRLWFRVLAETALAPDQELSLLGVENTAGDAALGLLALCQPKVRSSGLGPLTITGFHNVYTLRFAPLVSPQAGDRSAVIAELVRALCALTPQWDKVSFRMLEQASGDLDHLASSFRDQGLTVEPFFQFGNWFEDIEGRSFEAFLETRSKRIKKTLAWKTRRFGRKETARFELIGDGDALQQAIADYHKIYEISWKEPESNPALMQRLIDECAAAGHLRMGILHYEDAPVAVWLFILFRGHAIALKTAYDESVPKNLSIGAVLTFRCVEQLLKEETVSRIDFGIGDEPYKAEWLSSRQERWGLDVYNRRTLRGALLSFQANLRALGKRLMRRAPAAPAQDS